MKGITKRSARSISRRDRRRGVAVGSIVVVSLFGFIDPIGASSFVGRVLNSASAFSSGTLQLKGTTPTSINCYSTGTGSGGTVSTNANSCSGNLYPTGLLSTVGASVTSTLTSNGTANPTGGTVTLTTCGVQQVADAGTGADTGLTYGGVTYAAPFTSASQGAFTDTAVTLDGNATTSYVGTITSRTAPSTFSLTAWVKTTTATGGVVIGMSNSQTNSSSATPADRMLFVNSTGHVVFNMYNSTATVKYQATSVATVTDGAWHFVVATYSSATGLSLYVDAGAPVTTAAPTNDAYTAYWHLGWNPTTGWTGAPTSNAWNGSLYGLSVLPSVLSAANVTTLYKETSASAYASAITTTFAATDFWPLHDSGTVPFTGTIPALGAAGCTAVQVYVQETRAASSTCLFPNSASACASYSALSSLGSQTIALPPTSAATTSIVVSMKVTSTPVAGVNYLHVLPGLTFTTSLSPWSAALFYNAGSVEL